MTSNVSSTAHTVITAHTARHCYSATSRHSTNPQMATPVHCVGRISSSKPRTRSTCSATLEHPHVLVISVASTSTVCIVILALLINHCWVSIPFFTALQQAQPWVSIVALTSLLLSPAPHVDANSAVKVMSSVIWPSTLVLSLTPALSAPTEAMTAATWPNM